MEGQIGAAGCTKVDRPADKTRRELIGAAALAMALIPASVRSQERFPARTSALSCRSQRARPRTCWRGCSPSACRMASIKPWWSRMSAVPADRSVPIKSQRRFPTATRFCFTISLSPPRLSSLQFVGRSRHDIEQDFVPIAVGAYVPLLLLAHPSIPARDLKEFVEFAKQTKEPLFYGSTGPGSIMNLMGEVLKRDTGIKMDHVPFRGAAPLVQEMLSGRIQFGGDQLSSSLQHVKAGALKALAVTTRSAALPDVPSARELGFQILTSGAGTASSRPRAPRSQ